MHVNFLGSEGEQRIRQAYPTATHGRLASVKTAYDPENVVRFTPEEQAALSARYGDSCGPWCNPRTASFFSHSPIGG